MTAESTVQGVPLMQWGPNTGRPITESEYLTKYTSNILYFHTSLSNTGMTLAELLDGSQDTAFRFTCVGAVF